MTSTVLGFGEDTLDEDDLARILSNTGARQSFPGAGAFQVGAVPNQRQVKIDPGVCYIGVIEYTNDQPVTLSIPAASAGRWNLVALRTVWPAQTVDGVLYARRTVTPVIIPGDTTTTATPQLPPSLLPIAAKQKPGNVYDAPLAWVWTKASSTNLVIFDMRDPAPTDRLSLLEQPTFVLGRRVSAKDQDTWTNNTFGEMSFVQIPSAAPGWYEATAHAVVYASGAAVGNQRLAQTRDGALVDYLSQDAREDATGTSPFGAHYGPIPFFHAGGLLTISHQFQFAGTTITPSVLKNGTYTYVKFLSKP